MGPFKGSLVDAVNGLVNGPVRGLYSQLVAHRPSSLTAHYRSCQWPSIGPVSGPASGLIQGRFMGPLSLSSSGPGAGLVLSSSSCSVPSPCAFVDSGRVVLSARTQALS